MNDNIEQAVEETQEAPTETVEETVEEVVVDEPEEQAVEEPSVDRSAFNCVDCQGEGLKSETELCPTCSGTGKV